MSFPLFAHELSLLNKAKRTECAHWRDSQRAFDEVKDYYDKLKLPDRAVYGLFDGPHEIHGDEAFAFFDKWLK